jgi:hypothetical protein
MYELGGIMGSPRDRWIKETQSFQRIARMGGDPDSYEYLGREWDKDEKIRLQRRKKQVERRA